MAQQSNVPEFGRWDGGRDVPYTAYFENARNKRSGVKTNLNNSEENPRTFSDNVAPVQAPPFQMDTKSGSQKGRETLRTKHAFSRSRENADLRSSSSQLHHNTDRRVGADSSLHGRSRRGSSDAPKKAIQMTVGHDRRIEQSPLHPSHQARLGIKVNGTSERKSSIEGSNNFAPLTPGRPKVGSVTRGHETPDHGAAVPKFGAWDESNPASADGYTHVFNKVREEKLNNRAGQAPVPATPKNSLPNSHNKHDNEMSKRCFCFQWFGK